MRWRRGREVGARRRRWTSDTAEVTSDTADAAADTADVAVDSSDDVEDTVAPDPCDECLDGEACVDGLCVCERVVDDGGTLRFDIPVATVTATVTLGGGAFIDRPDADDQGALDLRDASGENIRLLTFTPSGQAALTATAKVVPGRYDLYYAATAPNGVELPANSRVLLKAGVGVAGDTTITADLPFVDQRFVVTFRGGAFPDVAGDGATIALDDARVGTNGPLGRYPIERFATPIADIAPDGRAEVLATVRLAPGPYEVVYDAIGRGIAKAGLPENGRAVIGSLAITSGAAPIPIDVAPLDVSVTLAPRPAVVGASDRAFAYFDIGDGDPSYALLNVVADGTAHIGTIRLLPGRYDLVVGAYVPTAPNAPPIAHPLGRVVLDALVDATHASFEVALEGAATTFTLTLDGGPFAERFGGTNDVGAVDLVDARGNHLPLFAKVTPTGLSPSRTVEVVPGRYDVLWTNAASTFLHGSEIPVGQAWLARGLVLGDTPREVALDVPTVEVTFDLTLGGAPLPAVPDTDDRADVWLEDPLGRLDPLFESIRPIGSVAPVTRLVVPGAYRVIYASREVSSFESPRRYGEALPVSDRRVVAELVLDADQQVALDLRFASVRVEVGYDGGPFPSPNPPREPMVLAWGGGGLGDPVVLFRSFVASGQPSVARTLRLLAGTARLHYQRVYFLAPSIGVEVPANPDRPIGCAVVAAP